MAYDEDLANRIRGLIENDPAVTERKMFGGLAFLVEGHMAVTASGQGGLLLRVDPEETAAIVERGDATLAEMRGRTMSGWLRIAPDRLEPDDALAAWVELGVAFARTLPPK